MDVAVVHFLPTGGALRVLSEWLVRSSATRIVVYTRDAGVHQFAPLPRGVEVVEVPVHPGDGMVNIARRLATSARDGARLAAQVDAGGHDVVFCFASRLTQAADVLPFLKTPSIYYAPEPLRSAYEPKALMHTDPGWTGKLTRANLNPVEWRRAHLDRRYIRAAKTVVTHSTFTQQTLRAIYSVDSVVVPLGVDVESFVPLPGPRTGDVLSVGALHPLKGHDLVIDALAGLPASRRPRLVIVGDRGGAESDLKARAANGGVDLELLRGIPFHEVVARYQRAGVVVCAQRREPFGLVPLEAMACATAVVAVEEGGFRETIQPGVTGLLVPVDPAALGAAVARVLDDPLLADRLGQAGRDAVLRDWKWEVTAERYDALLADATLAR